MDSKILLHPGDGHRIVDVQGEHVLGDDILHTYERKVVGDYIFTLADRISLLDVTTSGERKTHHYRSVCLLSNGEVELGSVDHLSGIHLNA